MSASDVSHTSALFPESEGKVAETSEMLQDGFFPRREFET